MLLVKMPPASRDDRSEKASSKNKLRYSIFKLTHGGCGARGDGVERHIAYVSEITCEVSKLSR